MRITFKRKISYNHLIIIYSVFIFPSFLANKVMYSTWYCYYGRNHFTYYLISFMISRDIQYYGAFYDTLNTNHLRFYRLLWLFLIFFQRNLSFLFCFLHFCIYLQYYNIFCHPLKGRNTLKTKRHKQIILFYSFVTNNFP